MRVDAEREARAWERAASAAQEFVLAANKLLEVSNLYRQGVEEARDLPRRRYEDNRSRGRQLLEDMAGSLVALQIFLPSVREEAGAVFDSASRLYSRTYPEDPADAAPRRGDDGEIQSLHSLWHACDEAMTRLKRALRKALGAAAGPSP